MQFSPDDVLACIMKKAALTGGKENYIIFFRKVCF